MRMWRVANGEIEARTVLEATEHKVVLGYHDADGVTPRTEGRRTKTHSWFDSYLEAVEFLYKDAVDRNVAAAGEYHAAKLRVEKAAAKLNAHLNAISCGTGTGQ